MKITTSRRGRPFSFKLFFYQENHKNKWMKIKWFRRRRSTGEWGREERETNTENKVNSNVVWPPHKYWNQRHFQAEDRVAIIQSSFRKKEGFSKADIHGPEVSSLIINIRRGPPRLSTEDKNEIPRRVTRLSTAIVANFIGKRGQWGTHLIFPSSQNKRQSLDSDVSLSTRTRIRSLLLLPQHCLLCFSA